MTDFFEFKDIIGLWPSTADFGRDIGISPGTARAMKRRNSIAAEYWNAVVDAAIKREFLGITLKTLADISSLNIIKPPEIVPQ